MGIVLVLLIVGFVYWLFDQMNTGERGDRRLCQGDYNGPIQDLSNALAHNPHDAVAYNNRGLAYANLGNNLAAIADYDRAIRLNPYEAAAFNNRGIAREAVGDLRGATEDYTQVIHIAPYIDRVYFQRGFAYLGLQDCTRPIADFNQAIHLNHEYAQAYKFRGIALGVMGYERRAAVDLHKAARLFLSQGFLSEHNEVMAMIRRMF